MKKSFSLEIKSPCEENLDLMNKTVNGYFCNLCSNEVIDFSKKNNAEIQKIFSENKGNKICGKFINSQIESQNSKKYKTFLPLKYVFLASLLYAKNSFSQTNESISIMDSITSNNQLKPQNRIILGMPTRTKKYLSNMYVFSIDGSLIINDDLKKEALKNMSIYFLGSNDDSILEKSTGKFFTNLELEKDFATFYIVIKHKKKSITKTMPFLPKNIQKGKYYLNVFLNNDELKKLKIN